MRRVRTGEDGEDRRRRAQKRWDVYKS